MRRWLLLVFMFFVSVGYLQAAVITVDDDGPAQYSNIQDAINVAVDGDEVLVSPGHYYENIDFRGKAITVTSTDPTNPSIVETTIIDANSSGIVVSFHMDEGADSIISGFTVTGGYDKYGAGICCWGDSSPSITHCVIKENRSDDISDSKGAGVYINNGELENCTIKDNQVKDKGGGVYCMGDNILIKNCVVMNNSSSNEAGGIFCDTNCEPEIIDSIIDNNTASVKGGGIYCNRCPAIITRCTIINNSITSHGSGGGLNLYDCSPIIEDTTITNNSANYGGGVYSIGGHPVVNSTQISENAASDKGGGWFDDHSNPEMSDCTINDNTANYGGGVYSCYNSSAILKHCNIIHNSSTLSGGGIYCQVYDGSFLSVYNSKIINNLCGVDGGGVYIEWNSESIIFSSIICGNSAVSKGGGIFCVDGVPSFINCVLSSNIALQGGGIYCGENSSPSIINSILYDNNDYGIYAYYSNPIMNYNDLFENSIGDYGGWAWPGDNDISVDPCFVQPGHWDDNGTPGDPGDDFWVDGDYHLQPDSLCINAGDPCFVADPCEVDMDGEERVRLGCVDIGADEAGSNPADFDETGVVDLIDYSIFFSAWASSEGEGNWDERCNIAEPKDTTIDILDFSVYCSQWLWQAPWY